MKITSKNVDPEQAKLVEKYVRLCMRTLKKSKYELNMPNGCIDMAVKVLEVKHTNTARGGCAGAHVIRINLNGWNLHQKIFREYDSYKEDPVIGSREVWDAHDNLLLLVAHEVAHHVQYRHAPRVARFKATYRKPHGDTFKAIYRYLRKDLVNPMIDEKMNSPKIGMGIRIAA